MCSATSASAAPGSADSSPTMSFGEAEELQGPTGSLIFKNHATVRIASGGNDALPDLIVGDGQGKLWWLENRSTATAIRFAEPQHIVAGERQQWGNGYTGATLADVNADQLPDLLVAHSNNQISIHLHVGRQQQPVFAQESLDVTVQNGCQGRFDVADWDGDGLLDLIVGGFDGALTWHHNSGTSTQPRFEPAVPFHDIKAAYNAHPRVVDFDRSGSLDLLLGINWGTVTLYRNIGSARVPRLSSGQQLRNALGATLNIRQLNSDDTTPELCDLNRDGVVDLLSGGKNGRLFLMRGISAMQRAQEFARQLSSNATPADERIRTDATFRDQLFAALAAIQSDLRADLLSEQRREQLFDLLAPLAAKYPRVLRRQQFDLQQSPAAVMLAARFWSTVAETLPVGQISDVRSADALGFRGGYRQLLIDHGILLIDNDTATPEHLEAMHRLITAIPSGTWKVRTITVAGWLGPAARDYPVGASTGINIFDLPLGRSENSFAADSPRPGVTDVFLICLAHEIAHNMLDTVGRELRPDLFRRKYAALAQAAGPHVVFRQPVTAGIDRAATQQKFLDAELWDGNQDTWSAAWKNYFSGSEAFEKGYSRGNIQFFLDSPQEGFSTLANQYFADTQLMLEFCAARWQQGHHSNINQFLLIAEYLSDRQAVIPLYRLSPGGALETGQAAVRRDEQQRIRILQLPGLRAKFEYDQHDLVTQFTLEANERR